MTCSCFKRSDIYLRSTGQETNSGYEGSPSYAYGSDNFKASGALSENNSEPHVDVSLDRSCESSIELSHDQSEGRGGSL